jgi:hypothetical protein
VSGVDATRSDGDKRFPRQRIIVEIDQYRAITPQPKKLYVVVSMDFHACVPDADTIFERFDENAVFKEWRRTKIL